MITDTIRFTFIPLTHILLACTIATILTACALFHQAAVCIIISYVIIASFLVFKKKHTHLLVLLICALFSAQVYFKIQNTLQTFHEHQEFLHTPCIVKATILQKQTAQLDKDQTTLLMQTSSIFNQTAGTLKTPKKITLLMNAKRAQKFFEGQTLTIFKAILEQPKPGLDYQTYMIKEGIWATAYITTQNISITNWSNRSWFFECSTIFSTLLHASTISLFNPLFLGKREKSIDSINIQHQSLYWGIAHHMARSGIHLVTLFGLFMALFHYARIKHLYRYLICAVLMIGYFEISVPSISFLRALCMIMIQIIGKINKFQYSSVHALTLTTLFMVAYNPWYVLFLDFQLSFGITAVIIWLFQAKWSKTIAFIPKTLIPS
jgi:ComEC/Rec2-related protein